MMPPFLTRIRRIIAMRVMPRIETMKFAYPFGCVSIPRKLPLHKLFDTRRRFFGGAKADSSSFVCIRLLSFMTETLTRIELQHALRSIAYEIAELLSLIGYSPALRRATIELYEIALSATHLRRCGGFVMIV